MVFTPQQQFHKVKPRRSNQIVHVRSNHWICLLVENDKSGVKVFDSLYSDIPISVADMIIGLLHPQKEQIEIKLMKVQQQEGTSDCGVIAIAVATSLCHEEDPTIIHWSQHKMRPHLIKCLEAEKLTPFPKDHEEIGNQGKTKLVNTYSVHCTCRRRRKNRQKMRQCAKCTKLFHEKCITAPTSNNWICDSCIL